MTGSTHACRLAAALALAALATVVTAPGAAAAQDTAADEGGARARAQPLFARGIELVQEQRWTDALTAFEEAQRIFPSSILVFNIAYCERALGRYVSALDRLRGFLQMPLEGVAATRQPEAAGYVRELEQRIAHLTVRVPEPIRGGAEVSVDGQEATLDAHGVYRTRLDPGHHTVQVRRDGYRPLFWDRDIGAGGDETLDAQLERLPGHLVVTSATEDAVVVVNGAQMGPVPFDADVEPGHLRIEVRADGYISHRSVIDLAAGDATRVRANLVAEPVPLWHRWWFWTVVTVALAGAAVGTYFLARPDPVVPPWDGGNLGWVVCPGMDACPP